MPERIQLRRSKGWRKPPGVVVVSRPSRWGNPYRVVRVAICVTLVRWSGPHWHVVWPDGGSWCFESKRAAAARAAELFRWWLLGDPDLMRQLRELAGRDVACWCALGDPCHGDEILELANLEASP
jgi:hypothetical protein